MNNYKKYPVFAQIKDKIKTLFQNYNSVKDSCTLINIRRIYYLSLVSIPIRVLDIIIFVRKSSAPKLWTKGIVTAHFSLLIVFIFVFLVTLRLRNKTEVNLTMKILQYLIPIIILVSGIIITTIDQYVTTNITPFLIVNIAFGAIFIIRPIISIIISLGSYFIFYFSIAFTISNPDVLLSNRVNGVTAIVLGLLISVMNWHYNYTNITQKRCIDRQQKQLEQMAYFDPLTNLYNRHYLDISLEKELSSIERYKHDSIIIIMDIDSFKSINDTYGHLVGDEVLKQFSQLILNNIRKTDTMFRFGGEEFIILAPRTSLKEGYALAEKLRKIVAEKDFITGQTTTYITASFGVSLLRGPNNNERKDYFSLADRALYMAKTRGKNRVEKVI